MNQFNFFQKKAWLLSTSLLVSLAAATPAFASNDAKIEREFSALKQRLNAPESEVSNPELQDILVEREYEKIDSKAAAQKIGTHYLNHLNLVEALAWAQRADQLGSTKGVPLMALIGRKFGETGDELKALEVFKNILDRPDINEEKLTWPKQVSALSIRSIANKNKNYNDLDANLKAKLIEALGLLNTNFKDFEASDLLKDFGVAVTSEGVPSPEGEGKEKDDKVTS